MLCAPCVGPGLTRRAGDGTVRKDTFVSSMVSQAQASGLCASPEQAQTLAAELEQEFT